MESKKNIFTAIDALAKIKELHGGLSHLSTVNASSKYCIRMFYLTQKYNIIYDLLLRIRDENITTLAGISAVCFQIKHISNELRSFLVFLQ